MNITSKSAASLTASAAAAANTYNDLNGLAALKKDPSSPQALRAVAQQIDALFLQMMLKSMRDASAEVGQADSNEMGMYQDMFDKQIALTLSERQDLGLGSQLTRQLSQAAAGAQTGSVAGGSASAAAASASSTAAAMWQGGADPASGTADPQAERADADGSGAGTPPPAAPASPAEFVSEVFPAIQRAAAALGVNPFAMLAQAALETSWGRRMPKALDGTPSRNLFGIKADDSWSGARAAADTVEFSGGIATVKRTVFRAYESLEESVNDFARLLSSSPRYRDAVTGGADIRAYVEAMGRSGYATDPQYANKLNGILNSATFRLAVGRQRVVL